MAGIGSRGPGPARWCACRVPLAEALDLVAKKLRETAQQHGKDAWRVYGSAQWTIPDAYVASKLFKGALGTNNVETSARLYAASAMSGFESSFGLDGAIGCYDDIEHADVFVLWDDNLAETDPVLFSRMLARRRPDPAVRIIDLSTRTTRTSYAADQTLLHRPHRRWRSPTPSATRSWPARLVHQGFRGPVTVAFKRGKTDIGYGLSEEIPIGDDATAVTWDDYVAFLADYTPEQRQELSGVPAETIRWLASLYGDRARKVMSVWGAKVNQDVRGTWINNLAPQHPPARREVASPGNSPFCTRGSQAAGVGARRGHLDAHLAARRRPGRLTAARSGHLGVPVEQIDSRPTHSALSMFRALQRGKIRFLWIQCTDPMLSLPNLSRYRAAAAKDDRFIVVSEAYPTPTTDVADVILPAAMWIEREGVFANVERRAQHFERMVAPPGEATSDAWLMIEVARRLGFSELFPWDRDRHVEQVWEEYRRFHPEPPSALPPLTELRAEPGLMWPYVNGRETRWRCNTAHDPAAERARGAFDFYGHPDHRAWVWLRPYEPPAESPDPVYPFWLGTGAVLEHWGTGSMTQRIPTLHRSIPHAYVEINREDATRLGIRDGETVRLVSRRGALEIQARLDYRSQPSPGQIFVPVFDEAAAVNRLTLDACCPLSGQPDATKCAVRVERLVATSGP